MDEERKDEFKEEIDMEELRKKVNEFLSEDKEEVEEDEIDPEELKQIIDEFFNQKYTVNYAIKYKKVEDESIKNSFLVVDKLYKGVKLFGRILLIRLRLNKLLLKALKFYCVLINNGRDEVLSGLLDEFNNTINELNNLNGVIKSVNKARKELKKYNAHLCNIQLIVLLEEIHLRQKLLFKSLIDYSNKCHLAVKGINYIESNKNQEVLEELNDKIENSIKTLGLNK